MKGLAAALFILFAFTNTAYTQITYNYKQNIEHIDSISDQNTLSCRSNTTYEQGNDQIEKLNSFKNKSVYIKYFEVLGKKYYVGIRELSGGAFNLDEKSTGSFDKTLKK